MTRDEAKALLPIIQAYADGKEIQHRAREHHEWVVIGDCSFNFSPDCYRIKPELQTVYVVFFDDGTGRYWRIHSTREGAEKDVRGRGAANYRIVEVRDE